MKSHLLTSALLGALLSALPGLSAPSDTFYEANMSLTRAARQEKEGDYKAALESSRQAVRLLQTLKKDSPEWNPAWVDGKLETASQLGSRVEPLAQKTVDAKKEDYSLKPGEWRDSTIDRAYKAHAQQKMVARPVYGTVAAKTPAAPSSSSPAYAPAPAARPGASPAAAPRIIVMPRPVPAPSSRPYTPPPRRQSTEGGRFFRIG